MINIIPGELYKTTKTTGVMIKPDDNWLILDNSTILMFIKQEFGTIYCHNDQIFVYFLYGSQIVHDSFSSLHYPNIDNIFKKFYEKIC